METFKNSYIDFILKTKGVSRAYATLSDSYLKHLFEFLRREGITDITALTRDQLDRYQRHVMSKECALSTKYSILLTTMLFFRYLYDYGHIKENVGIVIELPKKSQRIPRHIMNEEEITYLLSLPDKNDLLGARDICIMKLLYASAMRPKEIFNLKIEDLDLIRNQAIVHRPKNRRDRITHFDRYTAFYLRKYLKDIRPWLLKNRISDNIFISATGTNLTNGSWSTYFSYKYKPAVENKFKKSITPYAFRHSSATHWLDSGSKQKRDVLPYIQKQLGHESLESTAIYTHVAIEPLREMFRKYHPRDISLKKYHAVPTPEDIISSLKGKKGRR